MSENAWLGHSGPDALPGVLVPVVPFGVVLLRLAVGAPVLPGNGRTETSAITDTWTPWHAPGVGVHGLDCLAAVFFGLPLPVRC